MIVRAGTAVTIPILFSNGHPDGPVNYKIYGSTGAVLSTGQVVVPADAVSVILSVPAEMNLLATGSLLSYRDIEWNYLLAGLLQTGELRYSIEARLPYGVSADGVRAKLGVDKIDLPDSDISLVRALVAFQSVVTAEALAAMSPDVIAITDAIEAQAALALIPTMTVRIAAKESSGTNQFQRQKIDWDAIASHLSDIVNLGYLAVVPTFDATADYGSLLIVVTPATDAITGVAA